MSEAEFFVAGGTPPDSSDPNYFTLAPRAPDLLIEAADCIGDRADQRDLPGGERSMATAVATFNALTGHTLTERDGWVFMGALKLARAQAGRFNRDDYVDAAAYCALAGECAADEP